MPIRREKVRVVVDDALIAAGHPGPIVEPVWFLSDIYHGAAMYEHSLKQFSRPQRQVRAMLLYLYEVNNGGHEQFFSNSSGIVWRDAQEGFEAIGVPRGVQILAIAADRMGGSPSFERDERNEQLQALAPDFKDLDEALGDLRSRTNLDEHMMNYIRAHAAAFYFSGTIEKVILPGQPRS